jgi:hypothetical protein
MNGILILFQKDICYNKIKLKNPWYILNYFPSQSQYIFE